MWTGINNLNLVAYVGEKGNVIAKICSIGNYLCEDASRYVWQFKNNVLWLMGYWQLDVAFEKLDGCMFGLSISLQPLKILWVEEETLNKGTSTIISWTRTLKNVTMFSIASRSRGREWSAILAESRTIWLNPLSSRQPSQCCWHPIRRNPLLRGFDDRRSPL